MQNCSVLEDTSPAMNHLYSAQNQMHKTSTNRTLNKHEDEKKEIMIESTRLQRTQPLPPSQKK